jgi:hypothetical protein
MTDKYFMNTQELESINSELFDCFDPEQELWIIGGGAIQISTVWYSYWQGHPDASMDYDISWT